MVLGVVAPVFALVLLGFAAVKLRLLEEAAVKGLVVFVFYFAIPAMMFRILAFAEPLPQIEWGFLLSYFGGGLGVYVLGMGVGRFLFRRPLEDQATFGMAAAFSNTVLLGIPLLLTILGPEASLAIFILVLLHSPVLMLLTMVLIQLGRGDGLSLGAQTRFVLKDLSSNPIILTLLAGLTANLSGLMLPGPVDAVLELLGTAAVPCALFAMGAALAAYPAAGDMLPAVPLVILKLIAHPLLVWVVAVPVLELEGLWVSVAVLMATMPTGINVYIVASRYEASPGIASRTAFLSTAISVFTIPAALYLFGG